MAWAKSVTARAVPNSGVLPASALLILAARTGTPLQDAWWNDLAKRHGHRRLGAQDVVAQCVDIDAVRRGECDLDRESLRGQGPLEVVRDVGDEPPLAFGRIVEPREHSVHGAGEPAHFVVVLGLGDPAVDGHLTPPLVARGAVVLAEVIVLMTDLRVLLIQGEQARWAWGMITAFRAEFAEPPFVVVTTCHPLGTRGRTAEATAANRAAQRAAWRAASDAARR